MRREGQWEDRVQNRNIVYIPEVAMRSPTTSQQLYSFLNIDGLQLIKNTSSLMRHLIDNTAIGLDSQDSGCCATETWLMTRVRPLGVCITAWRKRLYNTALPLSVSHDVRVASCVHYTTPKAVYNTIMQLYQTIAIYTVYMCTHSVPQS